MDIKKELIKIATGIGFLIVIVLIMNYFKFGFWGRYIFLCFLSLAWRIWAYIKQKRFSIKQLFISWVSLLLILWIIKKLAMFGFIVYCLVISAFLLIKRRKLYMKAKHDIEAMIWGKPIYKYREKGMKLPKVKFIFKK